MFHHLVAKETYLSDDLYLLDGFLNFGTFSFALRKEWSEAAEVKKLFAKYAKSGVFEEMRRKHAKKRNMKPDLRSIQIQVWQLCGLFLLMLLAVIISLLLAAMAGCRDGRNRMRRPSA